MEGNKGAMKNATNGENKRERDTSPSSVVSVAAASTNNARFTCNVCFDEAKDPVVTRCGHLYCWPCIYPWLEPGMTPEERQSLQQGPRQRVLARRNVRVPDESRRVCPVCKARCSVTSLVPLYVEESNESKTDTSANETAEADDVPARPTATTVRRFRRPSTSHSTPLNSNNIRRVVNPLDLSFLFSESTPPNPPNTIWGAAPRAPTHVAESAQHPNNAAGLLNRSSTPSNNQAPFARHDSNVNFIRFAADSLLRILEESPSTSATTRTTSLFGGSPSTSATTRTSSLFGGSPSTSATTRTSSLFGESPSTSATTRTTSLFGGSPSTSATTRTTSLFGELSSTSATTRTTSLFGATRTRSNTFVPFPAPNNIGLPLSNAAGWPGLSTRSSSNLGALSNPFGSDPFSRNTWTGYTETQPIGTTASNTFGYQFARSTCPAQSTGNGSFPSSHRRSIGFSTHTSPTESHGSTPAQRFALFGASGTPTRVPLDVGTAPTFFQPERMEDFRSLFNNGISGGGKRQRHTNGFNNTTSTIAANAGIGSSNFAQPSANVGSNLAIPTRTTPGFVQFGAPGATPTWVRLGNPRVGDASQNLFLGFRREDIVFCIGTHKGVKKGTSSSSHRRLTRRFRLRL